MRSFLTCALAVAGLVNAAPLAVEKTVEKRAPATDIDATILNYALTLEHLEAAFYKQGLDKYSASDFDNAAFPEWVRYRLTEIASHEASHVTFLETALKAANITPTAACTYAFPDTDPTSFVAVAQILEGVGVSAYLGAASSITNGDYLEAAATILTVEARHNTWIKSAAQHEDGFPEAFDTPLGFSEVYSLAAAFIKSCPSSNPTLPVVAFPTLTLGTTGTLTDGQEITLTYPNSTSASGAYAIFLTAAGQVAVPYPSSGKVMIPEKSYGQLYVVIAKSNATISDDTVLAGPAVVAVDFTPATPVPY